MTTHEFSSDHRPVAATYTLEGVHPMRGFMPAGPDVIHKPIAPGANDPGIVPVGGVLHVRDGLGDSLYPYFNGPSGGIESHFYVRFTGVVEQYRSIYVEADANYHGNSFTRDGHLCGLVSIETEGRAAGPWTAEQLASIRRIITWANTEADVPIDVIDRWNGDGWGYHVMFGAPGPWTPHVKSCPGPDRIAQFRAELTPWLRRGGRDVVTAVERARDLIERGLTELDKAKPERKGAAKMAADIRAALEAGPVT